MQSFLNSLILALTIWCGVFIVKLSLRSRPSEPPIIISLGDTKEGLSQKISSAIDDKRHKLEYLSQATAVSQALLELPATATRNLFLVKAARLYASKTNDSNECRKQFSNWKAQFREGVAGHQVPKDNTIYDRVLSFCKR